MESVITCLGDCSISLLEEGFKWSFYLVSHSGNIVAFILQCCVVFDWSNPRLHSNMLYGNHDGFAQTIWKTGK